MSVERCFSCEGNGQIEIVCPECNGMGVGDKKAVNEWGRDILICGMCNHKDHFTSGSVHVKCATCDGSGEIIHTEEDVLNNRILELIKHLDINMIKTKLLEERIVKLSSDVKNVSRELNNLKEELNL